MKNVTPGQKPRPYVPAGLDRDSYLAGVFDTRLDWAEAEYFRSKGMRVDKTSGKVVPLECAQ